VPFSDIDKDHHQSKHQWQQSNLYYVQTLISVDKNMSLSHQTSQPEGSRQSSAVSNPIQLHQ